MLHLHHHALTELVAVAWPGRIAATGCLASNTVLESDSKEEQNAVADRLARSSLSSPPGVHLFSQPPEEIRRELEDDLAGVPVSHP
nr:RING-H2 finger protein ATL67-like [Ipomoea batatas]